MSGLQVALAIGLALVLGLAYWLWRRSRALFGTTGLPKGEIVYVDTSAWERGKTLWAPRFALSGKPDYVVRVGQATIPVEVKPGRRAKEPYAADVMQLAAYCLLVEEVFAARPGYGLLRYEDHTFRIPFDGELRQALMRTMDNMRRDLHSADVRRSHEEAVRCRFCGHAQDCAERLPS